jgi:hypothetical protein
MMRAVAGLALAGAVGAMSGCLERKIHVTSEPPGATVFLNDVEVGRTPVTTGFTYHGVYDVRLRKEGFEPLSTHRRAREPIWEIPPIDIVATALPYTLSKEHSWHFELPPAQTTDAAALIERARGLRSGLVPVP